MAVVILRESIEEGPLVTNVAVASSAKKIGQILKRANQYRTLAYMFSFFKVSSDLNGVQLVEGDEEDGETDVGQVCMRGGLIVYDNMESLLGSIDGSSDGHNLERQVRNLDIPGKIWDKNSLHKLALKFAAEHKNPKGGIVFYASTSPAPKFEKVVAFFELDEFGSFVVESLFSPERGGSLHDKNAR